jgi:hypothetical protein
MLVHRDITALSAAAAAELYRSAIEVRVAGPRVSYWSIGTAGWLPDADGGTLLLAPRNDSALLWIDTVGAWAPDWIGLLAEVHTTRRSRSRRRIMSE